MLPSKHLRPTPRSDERAALRQAQGTVSVSNGAGFTLIELLVVIGILGGLIGILVPIINSGRRVAKITATKNLISQIELAIDRFTEDQGFTPPDKIPSGAPAKNFSSDTVWANFPGTQQSSEALYYCLANPYVTAQNPYLELQLGTEALDTRNVKLPQIIDRWGRALEYHRNPYPTNATMPNLFPGVTSFANYDDGIAPTHNTTTYDLWSYGPTGYTAEHWIPNWK